MARGTVAIVVAVLGLASAVGGAVVANWHNLRPAPNPKMNVESCDPTLLLRLAAPHDGLGKRFNGLYTGIVMEGQHSETVQLLLARNGAAVEGSYFRRGVCGKVLGSVDVNGKLTYYVDWLGTTGYGSAIIPAEAGETLVVTTDYGAKVVFFLR